MDQKNNFCPMDQDFTCGYCNKKIAVVKDEGLIPDAESLYHSGHIPVPNFGWFCSFECAVNFEKKYNVRFGRTADGRIDYYS